MVALHEYLWRMVLSVVAVVAVVFLAFGDAWFIGVA